MVIAIGGGLYSDMMNAVAKEKRKELNDILLVYDGSPILLEVFLDKFGSKNPWEAASNAKLVQAVTRTPEELRQEGGHAVSESGHMLTNEYYVLRHKDDRTSVWQSGSIAITKIMEAFGGGRITFSKEGREVLKQSKIKIAEKDARDFVETLEEVLEDPSQIKNVQSTIDRHKIQKILGLDAEIESRLRRLDQIVYGQMDLLDSTSKRFLLSLEKGGTFWGRFERNLEELPKEIRDLYTCYKDPLIELPEEDRKFIFGALLTYAAINTPVKTEVILGSYLKDLQYVNSLSDDDHIIEEYGRPKLASIRSIIDNDEITLIDATKVLDSYNIAGVRKEVNKRYFCKFQEEFDGVLDKLEELFILDGRWREDSYSSSVPMKRLKETEEAKVLAREDFGAVRDALRIKTLAQYEDGIFQSQSLTEFKESTDSVVIAARKLKILGEGGDVQAYKRKDHDIVENFEEAVGIGLDDLIERCASSLVFNKDWQRDSQRIKEVSKTRIYSDRLIEKISDLVEVAKSLVPHEAIKEEFEIAKNAKHWLIRRLPSAYLQERRFHPSKEATVIAERVRAMNKIEQKLSSYEKEEELKKRFETIQSYKKISGGIEGANIATARTEYDPLQEPFEEIGNIEVYDPIELEEYVGRVEKDLSACITYKDLPEKWCDKLGVLCSERSKELFKQAGLDDLPYGFFDKFKRMDDKTYFQKELVEAIEDTYKIINHQRFEIGDVISEGKEVLSRGDLTNKYKVHIVGTTFRRKKPVPYHKRRGHYYDDYDDEDMVKDLSFGFWQTTEGWTKGDCSALEAAGYSSRIQRYNEERGTKIIIKLTKQ
jgi:hypothetical protein